MVDGTINTEEILKAIQLFNEGVIATETEIVLRIITPLMKMDRLTPELKQALEKAQDKQGRMIIHRFSTSKAQIPYLKVLLQKGANVNLQDQRGFTPAHYGATSSFGTEILSALAPYTPNFSLMDEDGLNPLNLCVIYDQLKNLEYLLVMGADPYAKNGQGLGLSEFIKELADSGDYTKASEIIKNSLNHNMRGNLRL